MEQSVLILLVSLAIHVIAQINSPPALLLSPKDRVHLYLRAGPDPCHPNNHSKSELLFLRIVNG